LAASRGFEPRTYEWPMPTGAQAQG
jgi:hypothetical protein